MRLIVNIPAFNEAEKIASTIKSIPRVAKGMDEVLVQVVDDGSSDNTARIARNAGADFVYSHDRNRGMGRTFKTSVEHALENGADVMVNIDADGQFNSRDIQLLLTPILTGRADMVSANRFGDREAKNIPIAKDVLNRFAARLIGWFMKSPIQDLTCGFRAYSRETLMRLNLLGDFTYTQEVIIDALGKNMRIEWVSVDVTYFVERKSRVVRSISRYVQQSTRIIVKAVRDVRPMKFFGIPGFVLLTASFAIFITFLAFYFQDLKITPYRNYLFTAVALFIVGLQFIVFALLADMVKSNRRLVEENLYLTRKLVYAPKSNGSTRTNSRGERKKETGN